MENISSNYFSCTGGVRHKQRVEKFQPELMNVGCIPSACTPNIIEHLSGMFERQLFSTKVRDILQYTGGLIESRQEWCDDSCQKTGGCCLVSHGRARQPPRQRCVAACRKAGARAGGGARGGSTGDSEPAPDGLSLSAAADGGRYTCVHAPAATGHPPASTSSGSGDQQLSESQHPTTTVTKPISSASIMYTSAFPTQQTLI
ncbi:unnamed protein product [Spodoptera exigua]|nr:unnamed protein product [Spodoptera exigua]